MEARGRFRNFPNPSAALMPADPRLPDLALVFVGLAYGADHDLGGPELDRVADALTRWTPGEDRDAAAAAAVEALAFFLDDEAEADDLLLDALRRLYETLTPAEREAALADAVAIAEADGRVLASEQSFIRNVAEAWHVKRQADALLDASTVPQEADWTLLHDVALLYVALAQSSDRHLSDAEVETMLECLAEWQPDLDGDHVEAVLRQAVGRFTDRPDDAPRVSAERVHAALPTLYRLALVSDLYLIAEVDGDVSEPEHRVIESPTRLWGLGRDAARPATDA